MTTRTLRLSLATLSVALCSLASNPKSETGQYGTRILYQSNPPRSFDEAYKVIKSQNRFDLQPKKPAAKEEYPFNNAIVPDLQVGCGDGHLMETTTVIPVITKHKNIFSKKERRKRQTNNEKTRIYIAYGARAPASYSYTILGFHKDQSQKPYDIPVSGEKDRGYLASSKLSTEIATTTEKVNTFDRAGQPILDSSPISHSSSTTRRPDAPSTSTFPPLVHNPDPNMPNRRPTRKIRMAATTATRTVASPPALSSTLDENNANQQPVTTHCAWAIINCCSVGSIYFNNTCFEQLECPGPFWGISPCENEFAREALDYAVQNYQAK